MCIRDRGKVMRLNKKSLLLGMIVLLLSCIVGSSAKNSSFLENVQASMVQEKDSDQSQDQPEIGVSALGYCVMNADTGEIVLQKNADEKLHPASITKIMTLLVTVEQCKNLDSDVYKRQILVTAIQIFRA